MRTFADAKTALNLQSSGFHTTKTEIKYSRSTVPAGVSVEVFFSEQSPSRIYFQYGTDNAKVLFTSRAWKYLTGFNRPPGNRTLEKYSFDGIAKTPTGHRTEPDGYGPDHSPSWLLVLGLI